MKVQINSLAALERLIGGDTEVEIEIRNNIVQEFTKKHLKSIADSPNIQSIKNDLAQQAVNVVTNELGVLSGTYGWNQKVALYPAVKKELVDAAKAAAQEAIINAVAEGVKAARAEVNAEYIKSRIDEQVKSIVAYEIREGVKTRLREISTGLA